MGDETRQRRAVRKAGHGRAVAPAGLRPALRAKDHRLRPPLGRKDLPNLTTIAALLLALTIAISCLSPRIEARSDDIAALVVAVNGVRQEHHLRVLTPRADLARIALAHAQDMAHRSYLSHVNPEGLNPLHRAQSAGLDGFRLLAENIGATSVRGDRQAAVIQEWLRSPDHRRNLLHPAFNATGVGITESPLGETLYVQLFATY